MKKLILTLALAGMVVAAMGLTGCAGTERALTDGYYTAEMTPDTRGWKEYVTICAKDGIIASVEFNAVNASGFVKAWDMPYMRRMDSQVGTYPNHYTREYARQLLELQSTAGIDTVAGATSSGNNFRLLADTVMDMAKRGDREITIINNPAGH